MHNVEKCFSEILKLGDESLTMVDDSLLHVSVIDGV